jgi:hypothetical protein
MHSDIMCVHFWGLSLVQAVSFGRVTLRAVDPQRSWPCHSPKFVSTLRAPGIAALEYNFRLCKISWKDERSLKGQECDTVSQKSVLALNVQYQVLRFLHVLFVVLLSFLLLSSWIFIASRSLCVDCAQVTLLQQRRMHPKISRLIKPHHTQQVTLRPSTDCRT